MSHFSTIRTSIKDEAALKQGLQTLGYTIVTGQSRVSGYGGQAQSVDFVVKPSQGYAIGFRRQADGNYVIVADWWGVSVDQSTFRSQMAEIEQAIRQRYAYEKVKKEVESRGMGIVEEEKLEDQTIRLVVRQWV